MTGMLASVRNVREAQLVLEAGVDILDLKDPAGGALGALDAGLIGDVVRLVDGRRPVSATIGDIPFRAASLEPRIEAVAATGVDFVKVGVFGDARDPEVLGMLRALSQAGPRLVLVFFAEDAVTETDFATLSRCGIHGVMLDTRDKSSGPLRSKLPDRQLALFVSGAREAGLLCGLAGSLSAQDIPALLAVRPDYLGFRGALCRRNDRGRGLDGRAVVLLRRAMFGTAANKQLNLCYMQ